MSTPFEELGLQPWADPEEIRGAYRALVKKCHPDMVQDPVKKSEAQERMIRLNLAYEEALRLTSARQPAFLREITTEEAISLAERMLRKGKPENALFQLLRAESRDALWYFTHGKALMGMERYHEAHQAFREAVRLDPDNNEYHTGALEAAVREKKEKTVPGKIGKFFKGLKRK